VSGIHAAAAPAMSKPMMMSRITAAHSITKVCATAVNPVGLASRRQKLPPSVTDMSIAAWPSIEPGTALSACSRAASTSFVVRKRRNSSAMNRIINGPPTNSARVNCQPSRSAKIKPSSMTRFVDAISNAIAAVKSALLRNSARANATAA
jgi:hypothetical protein